MAGSQLVKKFPAFYGTRRFLTAFTKAQHLSLSSEHSSPCLLSHFLKIHLNIILPSIPVSQVISFPQVPPRKPCTHLFSPHSMCPAHSILDLITRIIFGEGYRSWSSSVCSFLQLPVTSSLLGPNILHNTLFSNTASLCFSISVSDQVSHPYKSTGQIIEQVTTQWSKVLFLSKCYNVNISGKCCCW